MDRRLYWVWADMLSRCRNKNHKAYKNYGGRGIKVCEKWFSFQAFSDDVAPRPDGGMLDRKDNSLGYGPDNFRWASRTQQNSNRRSCVYVLHGGEQVTVKEYCRREGLKYRPIMKRIQDRGWPVQEALHAPMGSRLKRLAA